MQLTVWTFNPVSKRCYSYQLRVKRYQVLLSTLDFSLSVSSSVKELARDVQMFLEYDLVSYNIDTSNFQLFMFNIY